MSDYAHPEALVSADWVQEHLNDPAVRVVETDEDPALYHMGHIPGAVEIGWHNHLQNQVTRDYLTVEEFEDLCSRCGISRDTTLVFYGDKSNWWACYAFWVFKLYGHPDCRIMDGGYKLWSDQKRPMVREMPQYARTDYKAQPIDQDKIRAFRDDVFATIDRKGQLLDVRSAKEYTGELLHMEEYPQEGTLRGGHVPGALNVPWPQNVRADGTFKPADELRSLYLNEVGVKPDEPVIAYCRIGERSSLTWFVLTYLLGLPNVRNYDGSWLEWGNLVRAPIARGTQPG